MEFGLLPVLVEYTRGWCGQLQAGAVPWGQHLALPWGQHLACKARCLHFSMGGTELACHPVHACCPCVCGHCRHQLEQQAAELAKEVSRLRIEGEQEMFVTESAGGCRCWPGSG